MRSTKVLVSTPTVHDTLEKRRNKDGSGFRTVSCIVKKGRPYKDMAYGNELLESSGHQLGPVLRLRTLCTNTTHHRQHKRRHRNTVLKQNNINHHWRTKTVKSKNCSCNPITAVIIHKQFTSLFELITEIWAFHGVSKRKLDIICIIRSVGNVTMKVGCHKLSAGVITCAWLGSS